MSVRCSLMEKYQQDKGESVICQCMEIGWLNMKH